MKAFTEKHVKIFKTAALYFAFMAFGLCAAIPGPTLLDLQQIMHTETRKIAFIYLSRSASCVIGSMIGGIVFDIIKRQLLLLALSSLVITVCTFATPFCTSVPTLVGVWAICGFSMGAIDTGANVLCLNIWGKESAPYFQALHFLFGLGGAIAPLIAEPFLSKPCYKDTSEITSSIYNSTVDSNNITKIQVPCDIGPFPSVAYAYIIIGIFTSFVTLFFFLVSIFFPDKENKTEKSNETSNVKPDKNSLVYTIVILILVLILMSSYCGIEIGYAQMLATFAVKGDLKLSKSTASFLTALYWGTFTAARGVSVYLSYRFTAFTLVVGDIVAVILGCSILLAFANTYVQALWAGTFLLGAGVASFFPSVITWVEGYITINNKMASLFVIAGTLGEMIVPLTVSQYVESQPHMLTYLIMACSLGGCIIAVILWFVMTKKGPKK